MNSKPRGHNNNNNNNVNDNNSIEYEEKYFNAINNNYNAL
jgi:hypothetical protein